MSKSTSKHPDLILIHGLRGAPIGLEGIAKRLRQAGYNVHIPATPPYAGAPALDAYTPEAYADYFAQYIISQRLKRPVMIGHSMGTIIVSAIANYHPELIDERIILLSPIAERPAAPFRIISPLAALVPRHIVDYLTTRYLFVPKERQKFQETMDLTNACSAVKPPTLHDALQATRFSVTYSINDFLPPQQILIIAGAQDRLVGKHHIDELAEKLSAQLQFIPHAGHLHNYEAPEETAQLILGFLQTK